MGRGRRPLSDKQERILVQCQLMSLTTADLVTISNRLKALDAEREFKSRVNEVTEGFTWTEKDRRNFRITDAKGTIYDVKVVSDYSRSNWHQQCQDFARITVTNSRSRGSKSFELDRHPLRDSWDTTEIVSVCPEGNKFLFRMMRDIKSGKIKKPN